MPKPTKKDQIMDTANGLFNQYGIRRVTIEEICRKAGASKMTFYKYFANKTTLVRELWQARFEQGMARFEEIDQMDIPFSQKVHYILKMKEEQSAKLSHAYAMDYFDADPGLLDLFHLLYNRSIDRFLNFIRRAQDKGEVRKDVKPEFFLAVTNKVIELVNDKELVGLYPTYKDFVLEVNRYLYYGIMPNTDLEG